MAAGFTNEVPPKLGLKIKRFFHESNPRRKSGSAPVRPNCLLSSKPIHTAQTKVRCITDEPSVARGASFTGDSYILKPSLADGSSACRKHPPAYLAIILCRTWSYYLLRVWSCFGQCVAFAVIPKSRDNGRLDEVASRLRKQRKRLPTEAVFLW